MNQVLANKITSILKSAGSAGASFRELQAACRVAPKKLRAFRECIRALVKSGAVMERGPRLYLSEKVSVRPATVTRLNKTYGFARFSDDDSEVFIPGKFFRGALPGDKVLVTPLKSRGLSPEGEIVRITKEGKSTFTGTLHQDEGGAYYVRPDTLIKFDMPVKADQLAGALPGDKVLCSIVERGVSHADHVAKILSGYGDSQTAVNCAQAILDLNGIRMDFPDKAQAEAVYLNRRGILETDLAHRTDLRAEAIFTIDSADSKDLDDAVSIRRLDEGYELGVHIADVSHYVRPGSALDAEAFQRGTSIYFADRVIPMLPRELSNGICSLNPGEDRLAFSCIMQVDADGQLGDFRFEKTVIRSRVKGVYTEINAILEHQEDGELRAKYDGLYESIFLMKELADLLTACKRSRGAPEIETNESYVLLDEHSRAVGVMPRSRGASEVIIEEFMLMANEAAATLARAKELPFVYRVHEPPTVDKLENLKKTLEALGISSRKVKTGMPPAVLAGLLRAAKDKPVYPLVNTIVLRSMSKAKYFEQPIGHYGLVLQNYAQFTSPIRRYPDLSIHRILGDAIRGMRSDKLQAKYAEFVVRSSRQSTQTELNAMMLERQCGDCYKAEYMKSHVGEEFDGLISSLAPHGIYVELENSVEGLVKVENLPAGEYDFDGLIEYKNLLNGKTYRIGDAIRVRCTSADVSAGNVDFAAVE